MIKNDNHIIHKVFVEVDTNSSAKANELRANLSDFVQNDVLAYIEEYFSNLDESVKEQHIQIDRLDMNLGGEVEIENYNSIILKEKVFEQLDKKIQEVMDSSIPQKEKKETKANSKEKIQSEFEKKRESSSGIYSSDERAIQSVIHFVRTGTLPWWIPSNGEMIKLMKEESLLRLIESKEIYFNKQFKKEIHNPSFLKRAILQFPDNVLLAIFAAHYHSKSVRLTKLKSLFQNFGKLFNGISHAQRLLIWTLVSEDTKALGVQSNRVEAIFPKLTLFTEKTKSSIAKDELISLIIGIQSITQLIGSSDPEIVKKLKLETISIIERSEIIRSLKKTSTKEFEETERQLRLDKTNSHESTTSATSTENLRDKKDALKEMSEDKIREEKESKASLDEESIVNKEKREKEENTKDALDKIEKSQKEKEEEKTKNVSGKVEKEKEDRAKDALDKIQKSQKEEEEEEGKTKNPSDKVEKSPEDKENFIAENAGLILLHPFIKMFFKKMELLNDENELTDKVLAAHCLHFAATGKDQDFEFAMTFEKYLCGIPLNEPIPKDIILSQEMKDGIDEMLAAVLGHWKALKTSSIDLLRNEFIRRQGKIIVDEISPRIVIERKTIDMMLDKLPWGLSIVGLPWRKELIYVEW